VTSPADPGADPTANPTIVQEADPTSLAGLGNAAHCVGHTTDAGEMNRGEELREKEGGKETNRGGGTEGGGGAAQGEGSEWGKGNDKQGEMKGMKQPESAQFRETLSSAGKHLLGPSSSPCEPPSTPKPALRATPLNLPPQKRPTTGMCQPARSPRLDKLRKEWSKERGDVPAHRFEKPLRLDVGIPLVGGSVKSPPSLVPRMDRGSLAGTWSGLKAPSTPTRPLSKRTTVGQDPPSPALRLCRSDTSPPAVTAVVQGSFPRERVADSPPLSSPEREFLNPDLTTDVSELSIGAKCSNLGRGHDRAPSGKRAGSCARDRVVPPGTPCSGGATERKWAAAERDRSPGCRFGTLQETENGEARIAFPASMSDCASKKIMERVVLNGSRYSKSMLCSFWFKVEI
jgi:hypothetical protein